MSRQKYLETHTVLLKTTTDEIDDNSLLEGSGDEITERSGDEEAPIAAPPHVAVDNGNYDFLTFFKTRGRKLEQLETENVDVTKTKGCHKLIVVSDCSLIFVGGVLESPLPSEPDSGELFHQPPQKENQPVLLKFDASPYVR